MFTLYLQIRGGLTGFCFPLIFARIPIAWREQMFRQQSKSSQLRREQMNCQEHLGRHKAPVVVSLTLLLVAQMAAGQNLGTTPQLNVAVQGQTGAQPEGAFLNFINWIGNVISPVGAGGAIVGAIVSWLTGRGFGRWLFAAGALLAVSGVTRLIEFWITSGAGGVT